MVQNENNTETLPEFIPAPEDCNTPFPLRHIQHAYWSMRDGTNIHEYIELEGRDVDLERLNRSWNKLIKRHEMLRAVILPTGEQQISDQIPSYELQVSDLTGRTADSVHKKLEETRREMSHQAFPPDKWPLFDIRATCFNGRIRLHVSLSLLMLDLPSYERLFREWVQLYQDSEHFTAPPELSFRDYVLAEKKLKHTDLYRRSQAYWSDRLETMPSYPALPMNQNNQNAFVEQPHITRHILQMDPGLWKQIKQRVAKAGLTPVGLALAAFTDILGARSRHPHFTVNLTLADRLPFHPQVNEMIGNFSSMLPFEFDNSSCEPFTVRAERIQRQLDADMAHRYVNGMSLIQELTRRQKIADEMVMMPVGFTSGLGLGPGFGTAEDIFGEDIYGACQRPRVWLEHEFVEVAGVPWIVWMEAEGVFPENMVKKMVDAHHHLLKQLATSESAWAAPDWQRENEKYETQRR